MEAMLESTTFWVAVSFVLFWAMAIKPAKTAATKWLDDKIAKVERDLAAATALRAEAEALLRDTLARHDAASGEATEILSRAQAEAKALTQRAAVELQQSLERRERAAHERIAQLESQAATELKQLTAEAAVAAARSLLATSLDGAARAKLADAGIADLGKAA